MNGSTFRSLSAAARLACRWQRLRINSHQCQITWRLTTMRIGNAAGFWGDSIDAPAALVAAERLDFLTLEYLAELTMSILALQKAKDPQAGFASDFITVLQQLTPHLQSQPNLKIVTNAGGMNPPACAAKARTVVANRKIGVVSGDDLLPRLDDLLAAGHKLLNLDTGAPFSEVRPK